MRFNYKFENKKGMRPYKYDNGKIYKITSKQTDKIYIGSTTMTLQKRFNSHKGNKKCSSKSILEYDDCIIELIENYPCKNRYDLEQRERHYQEQYANLINIHKAGRRPEEIKEYAKKYNSKYQKENTTKLKNYFKDYYKKNKDDIIKRVTLHANKNIEEKKEYLKQYYLRNKAKMKADAAVKYTCELCNHAYMKGAKKRHEKTKKHINFINHQ